MKGLIAGMVGLVLIIALFAATADSNGQPMVNQQKLGLVQSVGREASAPGSKMLLTRIHTTQGRTYYAYNVMQGLEHTELTLETAQNGVRYLCGGAPKNCSPMVE